MKIQNKSRNTKKSKKIQKKQEEFENNNTNFLNKEFLDGRPSDYSDKIKYYNNSMISDRHGQENIEYSLFIISIQILFTALIAYIFFLALDQLVILLFVIIGIFDVSVLTFYIYFVIKFKKEEIFTSLPKGCLSITDVLNVSSMILKSVNFVLVFVLSDEIDFWFVFSFSLKYLVDIYFCFISLRIYMFCSCGMWCSDFLYKAWLWMKFYIFCCEVDETSSDMEYSRMEDMESYY